MKLSKSKLKQIIKEELTKLVREREGFKVPMSMSTWPTEEIESTDFKTGERTTTKVWKKDLGRNRRLEIREEPAGWTWAVWELFRNPDPDSEESGDWEITAQSAERNVKAWPDAQGALDDVFDAGHDPYKTT